MTIFLKTDDAVFSPLQPRRIFRPDAVRRYIENHQKTVLPRLICPRTFVLLWILLGFLCLAGILEAWHLVPLLSGQADGVLR